MELKLLQQLEDIIRQIARDEFILLMNKHHKNGVSMAQPRDSEASVEAIISSKIGWLKGDKALLKFYKLLISRGFIACKFELFKIHFIGSTEANDFLVWLSQKRHLVYLFNQLAAYHFIPESTTPHQLLAKHFLDEFGKKLKNGSLRTSLNNVRMSTTEIIDGIITTLTQLTDV